MFGKSSKVFPTIATDFDNSKLIKAKKVPIEDFYPGELTKKGKLKTGICPFHKDHDPSFAIYPNNTFYCFACHTGGDVIAFYRKLHGCDFKVALERILG